MCWHTTANFITQPSMVAAPLPPLSCEKKKLRESLLTRTIVTPEGNIKKDLDPQAALVSRDTLAKTLYSRLFDW